MSEDIYRIEMSRVFRFIGKYKYLLFFIPLAATAIVFLSTLLIEPIYLYSARFIPGYIERTEDAMEVFIKDLDVLVTEINSGVFSDKTTAEVGSPGFMPEIKASLIGDRIIEVTLEGGQEGKGEEALQTLLTGILNKEKEYVDGYTQATQQTEETLKLLRKHDEELTTLRNELQARAGLSSNNNRKAIEGRSTQELLQLSDIYIQLGKTELQLVETELQINHLSKRLISQSQVQHMEIIQPPKRSSQPVYPQTGMWVIVTLFLGFVVALLLALLIESYLRYRAERADA
jgi:ABC-type sugar transport system permease subunit